MKRCSEVVRHIKSYSNLLSLGLSAKTANIIGDFNSLVLRNNGQFNLVSRRSANKVMSHHMMEALVLVPLLTNKNIIRTPTPLRILDIGSGSGVLGIILSLVMPAHSFFSSEVCLKKGQFQIQAKMLFGLMNYTVMCKRVQDLDAMRVDVMISKAFLQLPRLVRALGSNENLAGLLVAMKGHYPYEDLKTLLRAVKWKHINVLKVKVMLVNKNRSVVLLKRM